MDRQTNYVGLLNKFSQRKGWTVQYDEVDTAGPNHKRQFTMRAVINNETYPGGVGHNKKEAKRNAAKNALNALKNYKPETSVNSSVSLSSVTQANFACWLNEYGHKKRLKFKPLVTTKMRSDTNQLCVYACKYVCGKQEFPEATENNKKKAKEAAAKLVHEFLMKMEHKQRQVLDQNGNAEENPNIKNLSTSLQNLKLSTPADTENRTADMNYIGPLYNYCQTSELVYNFKAVDRRGPAHIPEFVYKVVINRKEYPEGRGKTAKEAKQKAAELALRDLSDSSVSDKQSNFDAFRMATPSTKSTPMSNQETKSRFLEEFDLVTRVGRGGFGHVFKARRKDDNKIVAVKIVKFNKKAYREVKALRNLVHPNIVQYHTSWFEKIEYRDEESEAYSSSFSGSGSKFLYIQMEFCEGENLREWINQRNYNPEDKYPERRRESENIIKQILEAVKCVHSKRFIHRDLKPENIMFGPEGCVKVGDFGLVTRELEEDDGCLLKRTKKAGTRSYMSPEQRQHQSYDRKVDIYPVGLIFFELLWRFGTETEKVKQWVNIRSSRFPEGFSTMFDFEHEVIERMLCKKARERPEASDLLTELMQRSSNAASKKHNVRQRNRTY